MISPLDITRLTDAPIIPPPGATSANAPLQNINGPSLIRVPEWAPNRLGRYYLYYADHKGREIKLAFEMRSADLSQRQYAARMVGGLAARRSRRNIDVE